MKCKGGSFSARFEFSTWSKCQQFVVRHKDTGFHYAVDSVLCKQTATIEIKPSKSKDARRVARPFVASCRRLSAETICRPHPVPTRKRSTLRTRSVWSFSKCLNSLLSVVNTFSPPSVVFPKFRWKHWTVLPVRLLMMLTSSLLTSPTDVVVGYPELLHWKRLLIFFCLRIW